MEFSSLILQNYGGKMPKAGKKNHILVDYFPRIRKKTQRKRGRNSVYRVGNQIVHSFKSHFFDSSNLNFTKLFNQNKHQYCCKRPREEKRTKNQRPSRQEQQRLRAVDLVRAHLILYFSSILRAPSARPGHQEEADERG